MIALPRVPDASLATPLDQVRARALQHENGLTLLLVDDEPGLVEVARAHLEALGYRVTTAGSVVEASRALLEKGAFDVVVTDLHLGDGTGPEISRMVRSCGHESIVVLISGNMGYGVPEEISKLFDGRLGKPFLWSELDDLVQSLTRSGKDPAPRND